MSRAGALLEGPPERDRELRHPHVELVDELVADAAEAARRRPRAKTVAFEDEDVALAALRQEKCRGRSDHACPDDHRRGGAREIGHPGSSSKRSLPSTSVMRPNRGRSCALRASSHSRRWKT